MTFVMLAIGRSVFRPRLQSRRPVAALTRSAPAACTPAGARAATVAGREAATVRAAAAVRAVAACAGESTADQAKAAATTPPATDAGRDLAISGRCGRTGHSGTWGADRGPVILTQRARELALYQP